ncbi:hypothetical protein CCO03_05870 [Comamonas serinivorans]|uniref:ProQ/FinO domain-containing protein n=1 Tax=Comamonas serinivorans TaxID=1082851 RepID=A0A1Y0ELP4_9BURK|nr:ProQ/FINO family protein [Comamonas serinivorans]ARU04269.1 hypothetical protein CCO03_05870 [Comamonas serinivorans]
MNDTPAPQPVDAHAPANAPTPAVTSPAPANARPRPASRGATLGDAAGADALRALSRELRQARGDAPSDDADAAAASEFAQPGTPGRKPQHARRNAGGQRPRGSQGPRGNRAPRGEAPRGDGQRGSGPRNERRAPAVAEAKPARPLHPVLVQLRELYPQLFGEQPLPLKRGIYQDLVAAHPEGLDHAGLKVALGLHTRSYRYLNAVSQGMPRHSLQGEVVEAMAPEHVHHALLEVFRRRKPRDGEDQGQKLRRRIVIAFEASGLTRESYDLLVRGRNAEANAALDDAFAEVAELDAKAEALRRTFEASGQSPEAFGEMYGMRPQAVQRALTRCAQIAQRRERTPAEPVAVAAEAGSADTAPADTAAEAPAAPPDTPDQAQA